MVLESAIDAARKRGDAGLVAVGEVRLGFLRLFMDPAVRAEDIRTVADRATQVFAEFGDESGQARAWRLRAEADYLARRAGQGADATRQALHHAHRAGDHQEVAEIVHLLGVHLLLGPTSATDALAVLHDTEGEVGQVRPCAEMIKACRGALLALQGDAARGRAMIHEATSAIEQQQLPIRLAAFPFYAAACEFRLDQPQQAESVLRWGYDLLNKLGERSILSTVVAMLAEALYRQGRYKDAIDATRESETLCAPHDVYSHIIWRAVRGKTLARTGNNTDALTLTKTAVTLGIESDFLRAHADALLALAETNQLRGQDPTPMLHEAIDLYTEKGDLASSAMAERFLAMT